MDKHGNLTRIQQEYWECNIQYYPILFLLRHGCRNNFNTSVLNFKIIWTDSNSGNVTEKEHLWTPDVELLAVSF